MYQKEEFTYTVCNVNIAQFKISSIENLSVTIFVSCGCLLGTASCFWPASRPSSEQST